MHMQKSCQVLLRAVALGPIAVLWLGNLASAQSLIPSLNRHHMAPTGKPCLSLQGSARPQTLDPHIFEHWVGATNICGQTIKVQVCYFGSQDCIAMNVPPWGRQDSVLGIYPALQDFRFDAREQF
jgi:hypothetical protein